MLELAGYMHHVLLHAGIDNKSMMQVTAVLVLSVSITVLAACSPHARSQIPADDGQWKQSRLLHHAVVSAVDQTLVQTQCH